MGARALILTYHAVEPGPAPLCIAPALFRAHLDCLDRAGARTLTITEVAQGLARGELPDRAVAITFDDGLASVAREAAPLLAERGMRATVFCVSGFLGATNDWPTQPPSAPRMSLASSAELAGLVSTGFEIGSHGMEHAPLNLLPEAALERELRDSRASLEDALQVTVRSFAYPYGAPPTPPAKALVSELYDSACANTMSIADPLSDPLALPRVDAHYLRRPGLLRRAVLGTLGPYLPLRRAGARARELLIRDYAGAGER